MWVLFFSLSLSVWPWFCLHDVQLPAAVGAAVVVFLRSCLVGLAVAAGTLRGKKSDFSVFSMRFNLSEFKKECSNNRDKLNKSSV